MMLCTAFRQSNEVDYRDTMKETLIRFHCVYVVEEFDCDVEVHTMKNQFLFDVLCLRHKNLRRVW